MGSTALHGVLFANRLAATVAQVAVDARTAVRNLCASVAIAGLMGAFLIAMAATASAVLLLGGFGRLFETHERRAQQGLS